MHTKHLYQKHKTKIYGALGILALGGLLTWNAYTPARTSSIPAQSRTAIVYKTPSCGCCGNYVSYLKGQGFDVEVKNMSDLSEIKSQYNIPPPMQSCHTTIIGDYAVEGHMPIEAIEKLLAERPEIDGIALPGMPSGSPGMPGIKQTSFEIHGLKDGAMSEFMRF